MKRLVVFLVLLASMLSIKAAEMYVVKSTDGSTITFYYDDLKSSREGTVYEIDENSESEKNWLHFLFYNEEEAMNITTAVFDSSFANARPTSTESWFCELINLQSIENLQYLNTSEVTDMSGMFWCCESLESLNLSNFDTRKVTCLERMFEFCRNLKNIDVSSFNTSNVTNMVCMFFDCNSLEFLSVGNFDTHNVTDMNGMFAGCSSLPYVDVSNFDTSKVTDMSYLFAKCKNFLEVRLSSLNTSNVTDMNGMFLECEGLESIDLSNFVTNKVEDMSGLFSGCYNLTSVNMSSFNTSNVTNMRCMFADCSSLESIDLSNFDTSKVEYMTGMFSGCSSLTSIDVSNFDTGKVTEIGEMFSDCSSFTSLDVSHFDTSNVTAMSGMFSGCSGLTSLDVSNFDTSKVREMGEMFSGCSSLTSIDVSNFDTNNVNYIRSMFAGCSSLKTLDVSNFNTSNVKWMDGMFSGCSSITSLDVSNFDTRKAMFINRLFSGCSSLTSLDVSNFDTSNVTYMNGVFSGCSSLASLDVSNFDTSNVTEMRELFSGCSSLASLDISNFDISKIKLNYLTNMCSGVASAQNPCLLKVPEGFDYREDIDFSGNYFMWQGGYFRLPETDKLKVEPVTIFKGNPSTMAIELKNPSSEKYIGYQFKIVLPEGVSICKKDNGQYSYTQGNRYGNTQMMMNIREQNDGSYMVLCFSLSNTPISGHEGAILSLDVTSDGSLDDGIYEGAIRGIKFSTPEGSDALLPDATFKVNVSKYELGDVNNDGSVSISDITLAVNYILGKASDKFHASHADMNKDGEINIADLSEMVEIILNSGNNAPKNIGVTGGLRMESAGSECSLYLPDAGLYKGCQFLVRVPSGCRLSDVSVGAGRESGHRVMYRQTGTGLYKVLVFSADGDEFEDVPSALLRLTVDGQNGGAVELSDIRFTDTDFTEHSFAAVSSEVTGIGAVTGGASESTWYSLDGQKTAQPLKGVFVRDGRKIVVK